MDTGAAVNLRKLQEQLSRKPLDEIATLVCGLTYGEMIELSEAIWRAQPEGSAITLRGMFETFSPQYGIRVQIEGKFYDFAISFEHKTVVLFTNTDKSPEAFWISKTPAAVFSTILN